MVGGMVLEITTSGQKSQHMKQASAFLLQGMHTFLLRTGLVTLHEPVLPPSPGPLSL